ncbi:MAG TPA: zinc ABC transporter substrate-binding protein [Vitreimonas sp.]|nr:zinc ABC transporter substrate-binding protein [Vitreimonas sp.]
MKTKWLLLVILLIVVATIGIKIRAARSISMPSSSLAPVAVTTLYPVSYFTERIGGEHIRVVNLIKPGSEPHDFEPTPQDLITLQNAQWLIYNGAGFEPWLPNVLVTLPSSVITVDTSSQLSLLPAGDTHENETIDGHSEAVIDPHIWLDPVLAASQAAHISYALIQADPAHAETYQQQTQQLTQDLLALHQEFERRLATCQTRTLVTSHNAFQYLAHRYHLDIKAIAGLSPDQEPSPKQLAELSSFINNNHLTHVFFETLTSPKLAETLATETGAGILVFNPLEGLTPAELERGETYLSVQRQNLDNITTALRCSS